MRLNPLHPLLLGSMACLALVFWMALQNLKNLVPVIVSHEPMAQVSLGLVVIVVWGVTVLSALLTLAHVRRTLRQQVQQVELRREKADVRAETASDKIHALESKVQTLEKALQQALSKTTG